MPTVAGRCLRSPRPTASPMSAAGRIRPSSAATRATDKVRSALLVAGLAGLGRISTDGANSSTAATASALGRITSWTRMIDAAAGRGQAATVLVLTGPGSRPPQFDSCRPRTCTMRSPALEAHRPGLHRADDRRRGAFADVRTTPDDATRSGRSLPRHDGGGSRRFAPHARRLSQRSRARRGSGWARSARRRRIDHVATLGAAMARACALDGRAALGGASPLLRLPGRRRACATTIRRPPCRSPRFERPLPRILDEPEVEACSRQPRTARRAAKLAAVRNLALLELLYGSGLARERAGQPAARRGSRRASRS